MPTYISRDLALSHPFANGQYDQENANEHFILGYEGYKEWLEQLPTVDAEIVRHGHWISHDYDFAPAESTQECSVCHKEQPIYMVDNNYCPHCGAKMDEVEEDG